MSLFSHRGWRRLVAATAVLAGCQQTDSVTLTFGANGVGLFGFTCVDANNKQLIDRAGEADGGVRPVSLVFDILPLGGLPDCRLQDLVAWCQTNTCSPTLAQRTCLTLDGPTLAASVKDAGVRVGLLHVIQALNGPTLVSGNLGKGGVLFRMVGVLGDCDAGAGDGGADFDPAGVVGCAYSCPTEIGAGGGNQTVSLGFDTLTPTCDEAEVTACAGAQLP